MSDVAHVRGSYQSLDTPQQSTKELEAKQRDEVRQLNEAHRAEIDRLQQENKKRIDDVHQEDNAKLNEKDIQHQKEIEALRAMYRRSQSPDSNGKQS